MLVLKNINICLEETRDIVKELSLSVEEGQIHTIMGPNGSGKSSLALALAGHPHYSISQGSAVFCGENIVDLRVDVRAKRGIFLAMQEPCSLPGVSVFNFMKEAVRAVNGGVDDVSHFHRQLERAMVFLGLDPLFAYRDVNEGFSGGEKKRLEMLQLMMFQPKLAILDELDSGLDIDALVRVADALASMH